MTINPDLSHAGWVKSSYSGNGGESCVEWAPTHVNSGAVPVRDSKNPDGPALTFGLSAWTSFIASVQQDEVPAV
ncbi:DUF397 domain-containing protein [Streptomyces sp. WMMB 322]|uniref:DUF397 domain-containing protein n=1 Tax=Streptomyces sp. WMMB 322 TaxID=1286821 RepID=UPI0006E1C7C9|nr:DUF397 domain-containing protein [Streptomyces sp. WMMB 322]SCK50791.1 protein of unknown function [Streptomyces sp. WMMB 322]